MSNPILDDFILMTEKEDSKLQEFFNALLNAMNPNGKMIQHLMLLLASLRN